MLDDHSVKVTASLGVGLGAPGERGACDVPFVLFTEIAMPEFVMAEQDEFAIRFAVDSLRPVLNTRISSLLEVSARTSADSGRWAGCLTLHPWPFKMTLAKHLFCRSMNGGASFRSVGIRHLLSPSLQWKPMKWCAASGAARRRILHDAEHDMHCIIIVYGV